MVRKKAAREGEGGAAAAKGAAKVVGGPKVARPKAAGAKAARPKAAGAKAARPKAAGAKAAGARVGGKRRLAVERALLALPEAYAAAPDYSVVTILHETRAIEAILQRYGKDLLSGTKLDRKTPAEIGARRQALEEAERAWVAARESESPRSVTRLRQEAEGLVRDVAAALRYFLEHDAAVQRHVGAIREGAGDADRIDDLERCAELLELHADALRRADLPKKAPRRCRELADELAAASAERDAGRSGVLAAQELRNRAYWHLRELMDEVRAAGRYVFRHEPKRLALFRASSTNARHASRPPPPPEADGGALR